MKAISCNHRNGRHREALCPEGPQGPARYHSSLLLDNSVWEWLTFCLKLDLSVHANWILFWEYTGYPGHREDSHFVIVYYVLHTTRKKL